MIRPSGAESPPLQFAAGSDAIEIIAAKIERLKTRGQALSVSNDGEFEDTVKTNAA